MVTEPPTTPWPPVLGAPATEPLAVAFAGFDDAAGRLAEVLATPAGAVTPRMVIQANVELSGLLWSTRAAAEWCRDHWPTGGDAYDAAATTAGVNDLLLAFRWARDRTGHQLARAGAFSEGGRSYPKTYPVRYSPPRWAWARRDQLPATPEKRRGRAEREGGTAYDAELADRDLAPTVQAVAAWLLRTDARLTERV